MRLRTQRSCFRLFDHQAKNWCAEEQVLKVRQSLMPPCQYPLHHPQAQPITTMLLTCHALQLLILLPVYFFVYKGEILLKRNLYMLSSYSSFSKMNSCLNATYNGHSVLNSFFSPYHHPGVSCFGGQSMLQSVFSSHSDVCFQPLLISLITDICSLCLDGFTFNDNKFST